MPASKSIEGDGLSKSYPSQNDMSEDPFVQNLFVMRHGEQDETDTPGGTTITARPWDLPLTDRGKLQSWRVGRRLRAEEWNITRVVMSPFLRCVQTAAEVIAGLCMLPSSLDGDDSWNESSNAYIVKAWIELGLAEVMNRESILQPPQVADKNSPTVPWTLELSELYDLLPPRTCDTSVQSTWQKLPSWGESIPEAHRRLTTSVQRVADRFSSENILCITHGEGVKQLVSMMWPRVVVYGVTYSAVTHAQRPNYKYGHGVELMTGDWELLTESGPSSGIFFGPSP
jgi:broad specificity phosphatase PhoE